MHTRVSRSVSRPGQVLRRAGYPFFAGAPVADEVPGGNWTPPVDVMEEPTRILFRAELPGVEQEAIEITFEDGVLTIRGERKFEKDSDARRYHRIERAYGSFVRSFSVPSTLDASKITASFADGVLEVSVPKRDEARPRQIRIDVT